MNNQRRKNLAEISEKLESIMQEIDGIRIEEQEIFDNIPESRKWSNRAFKIEEVIGYLEDALLSLDTGIRSIDVAKEA